MARNKSLCHARYPGLNKNLSSKYATCNIYVYEATCARVCTDSRRRGTGGGVPRYLRQGALIHVITALVKHGFTAAVLQRRSNIDGNGRFATKDSSQGFVAFGGTHSAPALRPRARSINRHHAEA